MNLKNFFEVHLLLQDGFVTDGPGIGTGSWFLLVGMICRSLFEIEGCKKKNHTTVITIIIRPIITRKDNAHSLIVFLVSKDLFCSIMKNPLYIKIE